jgi:hypothetical protein
MILRYTLLTDGPFDSVLRRPIEWLLSRYLKCEFWGEWLDSRILPPGGRSLLDRIRHASLEKPDILFIHRDAEAQQPSLRSEEISDAMSGSGTRIPHVSIIPVRMTEAWFLFDEAAIRSAAGNPNGKIALVIPKVGMLERITDPKTTMKELLLDASETVGRRRKTFIQRIATAQYRVAELISDFSPLVPVPAFKALDEDVRVFADTWNAPP